MKSRYNTNNSQIRKENTRIQSHEHFLRLLSEFLSSWKITILVTTL